MKESAFQFTPPVLTMLSYKLDQACLQNDMAIDMENKIIVNVSLSKNQDKPSAIVELCLIIQPKDSNVESINIEAKIMSNFTWESSLTEDKINILTKRNAPALLIGYLRPIVAGITNASSISAYNLPFMDFSKD